MFRFHSKRVKGGSNKAIINVSHTNFHSALKTQIWHNINPFMRGYKPADQKLFRLDQIFNSALQKKQKTKVALMLLPDSVRG